MKHGKYTAKLGEKLTKIFDEKNIKRLSVYYDHGNSNFPNVCEPKPYFGDSSNTMSLSNLDIAIVDESERVAKIVVEIEEGHVSPKTILGDIRCVFLAEKIRIKNIDYSFDRLFFILGMKADEKGEHAKRAKLLIDRNQEIITDELDLDIPVMLICRNNLDELINAVEKEILNILFKELKVKTG